MMRITASRGMHPRAKKMVEVLRGLNLVLTFKTFYPETRHRIEVRSLEDAQAAYLAARMMFDRSTAHISDGEVSHHGRVKAVLGYSGKAYDPDPYDNRIILATPSGAPVL